MNDVSALTLPVDWFLGLGGKRIWFEGEGAGERGGRAAGEHRKTASAWGVAVRGRESCAQQEQEQGGRGAARGRSG
eukprot:3372048-Rhodomonas_salina.1